MSREDYITIVRQELYIRWMRTNETASSYVSDSDITYYYFNNYTVDQTIEELLNLPSK